MDRRYLLKLAWQFGYVQCWSHAVVGPGISPQINVLLSQDISYCLINLFTISSSCFEVGFPDYVVDVCSRLQVSQLFNHAKDSDKKLRLSTTDFRFLFIVVQDLLPQSMNWQSGVLIDDFPDMHLQFPLWVIGDKNVENCSAELAKSSCDS